MPKGRKGKTQKSSLHPVDRVRVKPKRKKLNAVERAALKAESIRLFVGQAGRQAQRGAEPNDRHFSRDVERQVSQLQPQDFDVILRGEDDNEGSS